MCFFGTRKDFYLYSFGGNFSDGAPYYFGAINRPTQCPLQHCAVAMVKLTLTGIYPINN
tara:strand:- start:749 stop:925 length:177 start_codon:yes stop_codon:yes gene_type:complete